MSISRYVRKLSARLARLEASTTSAEDTTRSELRVVLNESGIGKRTPTLLRALADQLVVAGIYVDHDLTDMRLPLEERLVFSRRPLRPSKVAKSLFPNEYSLERFVAINFARIPGVDRLKFVKTQFPVPGGQVIDMLCTDKETGDLVVVEFKHAAPDRGVVTQTMGYVQALDASPYAKGRKVRGLIITGLPDETLQGYAFRLAKELGHDLTWLVYEVSLSLPEVATTVPPRQRNAGDWIDVQSEVGIVNPQSPALASAMRAAGRR